MKILSINAGSSSLKFNLIELPTKNVIATGLFEKIGLKDSFYTIKYNDEKITKEVFFEDHKRAVEVLMEDLIDLSIISSFDEIEGIGHRVVHGGDRFTKSVIITEEVLKEIESFNDLAPLHNPANIMGIRAFMTAIPTSFNVAVFDTAFHQSMEAEAFMYAVPYSWYKDHGIRKYGFHGTSHKYIYQEICKTLGKDNLKVISCHIGSGASMAAIKDGKSIDTTMGFTPLAGLMMGTRCGDIDASILDYMASKTGKSLTELTSILNKESGNLGVSEVSPDNRDIENGSKEGNEQCKLAENMYSRRVANYIAMYNNILEGADVIVFTAGAGENAVNFRASVIKRISSLGVTLNEENNNTRGELIVISGSDSKIPVYVVPTDEELMIALETIELRD